MILCIVRTFISLLVWLMLLFSVSLILFRYDKHEMKVRDIAESIGFEQVSLSCVVMPMCRAVFRGHTACADAYLTPSIKRYVNGMLLSKSCMGNLFRYEERTLWRKFCGSYAALSPKQVESLCLQPILEGRIMAVLLCISKLAPKHMEPSCLQAIFEGRIMEVLLCNCVSRQQCHQQFAPSEQNLKVVMTTAMKAQSAVYDTIL